MNQSENQEPRQPADAGDVNPAVNPQSGQELQPQVVYMSRPIEPHRQQISPEAQQKYEESKRRYPNLNISEGEYVIGALKRHPIGLVAIWAAVIAVVVALFALVAVLMAAEETSGMSTFSFPIKYLAIPALLISALVVIFGFVATFVYNANRFFLTNESVIQHIQTSLFSKRQQTVSLANVEDASYTQDGIIPHIFNYGLIRLSTEGDETTYRFTYASEPEKQIAMLNNAVESFKNVRPIQ